MHSESRLTTYRIAAWRQRVSFAIRQARTDIAFRMAGMQHITEPDQQLSKTGWQLVQMGRSAEAESYFRAILHREPYLVSAWVGLSYAVATRDERQAYLQAALDLHHLFLC